MKNLKPKFDENSPIHHVCFMILNLVISNQRLEQLQVETKKKTLLNYTLKGCPEKTFTLD